MDLSKHGFLVHDRHHHPEGPVIVTSDQTTGAPGAPEGIPVK